MREVDLDKVDIRVVEPNVIRPMRQRVLRPHQPIEAMAYPGDDEAEAFHLAAIDREQAVIGIASFYRDPHPLEPHAGDWRLRGMAVDPAVQGRGLGSSLMRAGINQVIEQGGQRLWCNARVSAQGFYERLGFSTQGDRFEIDPIGPHFVMSIAANASPR